MVYEGNFGFLTKHPNLKKFYDEKFGFSKNFITHD